MLSFIETKNFNNYDSLTGKKLKKLIDTMVSLPKSAAIAQLQTLR